MRPAADNVPSCTPEAVVGRRSRLEATVAPTEGYKALSAAIAARQAIGDPPKPANDNQPVGETAKHRSDRRVRKSSGKFVRGSFADTLPMIMLLRNTPDHVPEPISSNWSVDVTAVIAEPDVDESDNEQPPLPLDMKIEITPSIAKIRRAFEKGDTDRGKPGPKLPTRARRKGVKKQKVEMATRGPIIRIGDLHFADGSQRERAMRIREGKVESYERVMPIGSLLRAGEKRSPRIGTDPGVGMSNTRLTSMLLGKDADDQPINWRPFIPKGDIRKGRSYTPEQSRALIAQAIANTAVMPPVTVCPPGIATGASRFSDQFVGVVKGTRGKGGALVWVDAYSAMRDREEFMEIVNSVDPKTKAVLSAAMTAKTFGDVGVAAGQSASYAATGGGGKLAMQAANDNLVAAMKARAA